MLIAVVIKRTTIIVLSLLLVVFVSLTLFFIFSHEDKTQVFSNEEFMPMLNSIFEVRDKAISEKDFKDLERFYNTQTVNGQWAYKYEVKRIGYLQKWADKQGAKFTQIKSDIKITKVKEENAELTLNFICSTEYKYAYIDAPKKTNLFRIVTYHLLIMTEKEDQWLIQKEWYLDPFEHSLDGGMTKSEEIQKYILSGEARDFSSLNARRIEAVAYADMYGGASGDERYGVVYNNKYINYNNAGGDCANFASQVLFEGGKFRKTYAWNYDGEASNAWVRADSLLDYMIYNGRASLIASGTYDKVYKASFKLEPGDLVFYETKGRVSHVTVVTGADSKGYALINGHNIDSYRAPWDIGWNYKDVKFYLCRVYY